MDNLFTSYWLYWRIFLSIFEHRMSLWHWFNVFWALWTSDGHKNNVVCFLGNASSTDLVKQTLLIQDVILTSIQRLFLALYLVQMDVKNVLIWFTEKREQNHIEKFISFGSPLGPSHYPRIKLICYPSIVHTILG